VRRAHFPGTPTQYAGLERDLELEKRKSKDMQDQLRDKDKEYTKLKVCKLVLALHLLTLLQSQYDKIKRKALLTLGALGSNGVEGNPITGLMDDVSNTRARHPMPSGLSGLGMSMDQVVEGMEANRVRPKSPFGFITNALHQVQRTPLRTVGTGFAAPSTLAPSWQSAAQRPSKPVRFQPQTANGNFPRNQVIPQDGTESDSANEVENMLGGRRQTATGYTGQQQRQHVRTHAPGVGGSGLASGRSGTRDALSSGIGGLGYASLGRTQSLPRGKYVT